MSDIVERLRDDYPFTAKDDALNAAEEIESLRSRLRDAEAQAAGMRACLETCKKFVSMACDPRAPYARIMIEEIDGALLTTLGADVSAVIEAARPVFDEMKELVRLWHLTTAERHPPKLRVEITTNCGAVYRITDALAKLDGKEA